MIKIYDTKTRTKREFVPVNEGKVGMYVCGRPCITHIHIGNARTFISSTPSVATSHGVGSKLLSCRT